MGKQKHSRIELWSFRRCLRCGAIGPHFCSVTEKKKRREGCPVIADCTLWNKSKRGCSYFTYVDEPFDEDCAAANLLHSHGLLRKETP